MSFIQRSTLAVIAFSLVVGSGVATAQETPGEQAGLIEAAGSGLVEKTETKKKKGTQVDPDAKMAEAAAKANKDIEARLSALSSKSERFLDISEGLSKVQSEFFQAQGQFYQNNNTTLDNYRLAHEQKNDANKKKWAKIVKKVRTLFLKAVKQTKKDLDKLQKLEAKLEKQAAEEDAEDAEAEGEEEAGDDDF
jgi:hypothetical protein